MLTDALCTRCGLCCDGTLFGDVELTGRREAGRLESLGLDVDSDDADVELLALPCRGLQGTRCSVYAQRPRCCRTFECRLLQETRRGEISEAAALSRVSAARRQADRVKTLLAAAGAPRQERLPLAERVADALATPPRTTAAGRRQARLAAAMQALSRTVRTTFLD